MIGTANVVVAVGGLALLGVAAWIASVWQSDLTVDALKPRWAPPPSKFVAIEGMEVHVRDEGPRDDPTPFVLLHGTGSSLHTWDGWAEQLQATRRVIRLDRPGFGLTGPHPNGDYSMEYYVDFLERLLAKLHVDGSIVLVGNSSGGNMAWRFAAAHPERVAKLVLIAPGGYPRSTPLPPGLAMAMNPKMDFVTLHLLPKSAVRKGARTSYGDPSKLTEETVDRYFDIARREGNRAALGRTLRAAIGHEDPDAIHRVKAPTLILWGTKDTVIPMVPDAEAFHQRIEGSTVVTLSGVGHVAQEEDPQGTLAAFARWSATTDR